MYGKPKRSMPQAGRGHGSIKIAELSPNAILMSLNQRFYFTAANLLIGIYYSVLPLTHKEHMITSVSIDP